MMPSPHVPPYDKTAPKITFLHSDCVPLRFFFFCFCHMCCLYGQMGRGDQPSTPNTLFIFTPAALSVRRWWLTLCCWVWTWVSLKITQDGHVSRQPSWQKNKKRGRSKTRGARLWVKEHEKCNYCHRAWRKKKGAINEISNYLWLHNVNVFLLRYQIKIEVCNFSVS